MQNDSDTGPSHVIQSNSFRDKLVFPNLAPLAHPGMTLVTHNMVLLHFNPTAWSRTVIDAMNCDQYMRQEVMAMASSVPAV
jgi:hypothetical protein